MHTRCTVHSSFVPVGLFLVGSDDSDSDFEKSGSASDDSVISEEVSGSEEDGKRRKTR